MTTLQPSTNSELQLFRVLQRANLLQYFDTFITQGGDDVQQLCEAGEDEFLEIMALVGMASKPLHVRRLQKALQEWVANPTAFDAPKKFPTIVMSMTGVNRSDSTPSPMSVTDSPAPFGTAELLGQGHKDGVRTPNAVVLGPAEGMPNAIYASANNAVLSANQNTASLEAAALGYLDLRKSVVPSGSSFSTNQLTPQQLLLLQQQQQMKSTNSTLRAVSGPSPSTSPSSVSSPPSSTTPGSSSTFTHPTQLRPEDFQSTSSWSAQTRSSAHFDVSAPPSSEGKHHDGRDASAGGVGVDDKGSTKAPSTSMSLPTVVQPSSSSDPSPPDSPPEFKDVIKDGVYNPDDDAYASSMNHPVLLDHQLSAIAAAAAILAQELPVFEPKSLPRKQTSQDIQTVMTMSRDDPNRLDALRKYAAIYGRFDSKRKNHRPMSLHEISVNEAAAQLCSYFPALLTRREELFPLARQVVRDSGYQYSKGHSRAAEVLVQPKLEPSEQGSNPSANQKPQTVTPHPLRTSIDAGPGASYSDLQTELAHITLTLSEMDKEQARIRAALRVLLEANDLEQARGLTAEMDILNDRQEALAKRRHKVMAAMAKFKKGGNSRIPGGSTCLNLSTKQHRNGAKTSNVINASMNNNTVNTSVDSSVSYNKISLTERIKDTTIGETNNNNSNTGGASTAAQTHKDSLFEEGLRIATQYGMSDFAKELLGMKTQDNEVVENGNGNSKESSLSLITSSLLPTSSAVAPMTSALFMSPFAAALSQSAPTSQLITAAGSMISPASSLAALSAVSSDNISASSGEYLAPATGCKIHTHPPISSSSSPASLMPSLFPPSSAAAVVSPASLLFPSVINSKQETGENSQKLPPLLPKPNKAPQDNNSINSPTVNKTQRSSVIVPPSTTLSSVSLSNKSTEIETASPPPIATTQPTQPSPPSVSNSPPSTSASPQKGSTTTTTTITTKSGQVIEVETRRSSRRKNGEPDYYLINGGEKRFRSSSSSSSATVANSTSANAPIRRTSTGERRKSNIATNNVTGSSISSPSRPYKIDPHNNNNNNSKNSTGNTNNNSNNLRHGDPATMKIDMNDMSFRNPAGEIHKVRMGFQQRI